MNKGTCNDCAYMNQDGICINRHARHSFNLFVWGQDGCREFESDNSFDENVDADFDDEW